MLAKKFIEENQKYFLHDKKYHYQVTDMLRQQFSYYFRQCEALETAVEFFIKLEATLSCFEEKSIPEWYTREDLEKDRSEFQQALKWAGKEQLLISN